MPRTLFISDLHLSPERPQALARFEAFLRDTAAGASALYVLGDLLEAWTGDDELEAADGDPVARAVAGALSSLARSGTAVRLMHGNRDFLMRTAFVQACGGRLVADPSVVPLEGDAVLLMHGDTLCTDDLDYQAWRTVSRSEGWQQVFLARPLAERRDIMRRLRERSRESIREKPAEVMDVNAGAVEDAFRRHRVQRMIHGHTHRPARHELVVDGRACERWVLPDWYGENGGWLEASGGRFELLRF